MDFVGSFPESGGKDYMWVVLCCLTSMVHLVPVWTMMTASELASLYVREIVCLHGVANSIVSDQDFFFLRENILSLVHYLQSLHLPSYDARRI